jgi:dihydrodipicolinate synthase/N-acetylneuraminate lyase
MQTTRRTFLSATASTALAAPRAAKSPATAKSGPNLYVAAVTPCDSKLNFDPAIYRDLMPFFKERGADGVVVLGTTGEFPSFSVAERKRVAEVALKHRSGLRMIVQVGTPNLPETLELLNHAQANGADGVLVIPPFYYKNPTLDPLVKHYSAVLEASKVPVYLYHIPGTSAVPISHELLHKLEHYPNLAGIKDSTGNAEGYAAFCKEFPKLDMMSGTDNNLPTALKNNMGAILMGANLFVKQSAAVFAAHRAGQDITEPMAKLREASALLRGTGGTGIAGIKYSLAAWGFRESFARPPQPELTAEQKAQIKLRLAELAKL